MTACTSIPTYTPCIKIYQDVGLHMYWCTSILRVLKVGKEGKREEESSSYVKHILCKRVQAQDNTTMDYVAP